LQRATKYSSYKLQWLPAQVSASLKLALNGMPNNPICRSNYGEQRKNTKVKNGMIDRLQTCQVLKT